MDLVIILAVVAVLFGSIHVWHRARWKASEEFATRAISEARRHRLSQNELKQAVVDAWTADHRTRSVTIGASLDEKVRIAGHLWRMGEEERYRLLHNIVMTECQTFRDVRTFVRWYEEQYADTKHFGRSRFTGYNTLKSMGT